MPSSRGPAALLTLGAAFALVAGAGCAHAPRSRAEPPPEASVDDGRAPEAPEAPSAEEARPEEARPEGAPGRLDPSEEITPEELATLPEPIGGTGAPNASGAAPGAPGASPGFGASGDDSKAPAPPDGLWRVQVHASESREEALRVGRAAARRLGVELFLEREGSLYKARLGSFAGEREAQALRDRAIRAGYPGAFRTRARP
jgi:hypothetical protein